MNSSHNRGGRRSVSAAGSVLLLLAALCPASLADDAVTGTARALSGDALIVRGTRILLFGLTAPNEAMQCRTETGLSSCAEAALDALDAIVREQQITCTLVRKVGHGAYQGRCRLADETDIGLTLLRAGWTHADADARAEQKAAEADARTAMRGMWASAAAP
jgi:endonuclease YncB( thermonuclease family)